MFSSGKFDTFTSAKKVDTEVCGYPQDPLPELFTFPKLCYLQQTFEHSILSDVFGVVNIREDAKTHCENVPVMALDKYRIRALVALTRGDNQDFI
jgi:hypothetical protein